MKFVIYDKVGKYYLVYDGSCSLTTKIAKATVIEIYLHNGELLMSPKIPLPFLTSSNYAWELVSCG